MCYKCKDVYYPGHVCQAKTLCAMEGVLVEGEPKIEDFVDVILSLSYLALLKRFP